eukprot:scaffold14333_cov117-Isochrysis_galbana.AAC.2
MHLQHCWSPIIKVSGVSGSSGTGCPAESPLALISTTPCGLSGIASIAHRAAHGHTPQAASAQPPGQQLALCWRPARSATALPRSYQATSCLHPTEYAGGRPISRRRRPPDRLPRSLGFLQPRS